MSLMDTLRIGLGRGTDRGAQVGGHAGGGGGRGIAALVTLELGVEHAVPGVGAVVVDQVADLDLVGVRIDAGDLLLRLLARNNRPSGPGGR